MLTVPTKRSSTTHLRPAPRSRPTARRLAPALGAVALLLAAAPPSHADSGVESCYCPDGADYLGAPVTGTYCGQRVCGGGGEWYTCQATGWVNGGGVCDEPPPSCGCPAVTNYLGYLVEGAACGQTICGDDNTYHSCQDGWWAPEGGTCPAPARNQLRVIEVRYMPDDPEHHPNLLSAALRGAIREGSSYRKYADPTAAPHVEVDVVDVIDHFEPRPDGANWREVYEQVLSDHDLCNRIRDEAIDQVWLWVDPDTDPRPGLEYVISSPLFEGGADHADFASPAFCGGDPSFVIMGFDTTETYDQAQHSFGHLMEGLLGNLQSTELFWYRFSGDDSAEFPRAERCGRVHFPPNDPVGYQYWDGDTVTSSCEDWNPEGTGATSTFRCERWGCTQGGFMTWWMQSMPNEGNGLTYQGKALPNWWDFVVDFDANVARYANDPAFYMNRDFVPAPLPFGLSFVDTVPATLQGKRDLPALFDGVYDWPHAALVHRPGESVGVVMEFAAPATVTGFTASVVGGLNATNTTWRVEAADSLADLAPGSPTYRTVLGYGQTYSGVVHVALPAPHRAKAFRVTTWRHDGDGTVHVLELAPTFPGEGPRAFPGLSTEPAWYAGLNNLPALFDGKGAASGFGVVHYSTPSTDSVAVVFDHGDRPLTWYGLRAEAGGHAGNPAGQHWKVESADTPADLANRDGTHRDVVEHTSGAVPTEIPFGASVRARLFKVTLTRNEGDGTEHIAELTPRIQP
jgi:hypothetical protein